jgi:hypothetical protein
MKKISLFLPIMATAKKKFHRDPTKIGFFFSAFDITEKTVQQVTLI